MQNSIDFTDTALQVLNYYLTFCLQNIGNLIDILVVHSIPVGNLLGYTPFTVSSCLVGGFCLKITLLYMF